LDLTATVFVPALLLAMSFSANARLNSVLPWRFLRSGRPDSRSSPRYLQGND